MYGAGRTSGMSSRSLEDKESRRLFLMISELLLLSTRSTSSLNLGLAWEEAVVLGAAAVKLEFLVEKWWRKQIAQYDGGVSYGEIPCGVLVVLGMDNLIQSSTCNAEVARSLDI